MPGKLMKVTRPTERDGPVSHLEKIHNKLIRQQGRDHKLNNNLKPIQDLKLASKSLTVDIILDLEDLNLLNNNKNHNKTHQFLLCLIQNNN